MLKTLEGKLVSNSDTDELLTSIKEGVQTEMLDTPQAGISPGGSPRRAGMNQTARGGDNNRGGGNYDMLNV